MLRSRHRTGPQKRIRSTGHSHNINNRRSLAVIPLLHHGKPVARPIRPGLWTGPENRCIRTDSHTGNLRAERTWKSHWSHNKNSDAQLAQPTARSYFLPPEIRPCNGTCHNGIQRIEQHVQYNKRRHPLLVLTIPAPEKIRIFRIPISERPAFLGKMTGMKNQTQWKE